MGTTVALGADRLTIAIVTSMVDDAPHAPSEASRCLHPVGRTPRSAAALHLAGAARCIWSFSRSSTRAHSAISGDAAPSPESLTHDNPATRPVRAKDSSALSTTVLVYAHAAG